VRGVGSSNLPVPTNLLLLQERHNHGKSLRARGTEHSGAKEGKGILFEAFSVATGRYSKSGVPDGTYTLIRVGEGTGGGIMRQIPGGPLGWQAYVGVDDIRAATKKAESLGGEVMKDVTEVTGMGWLSFIRDPTGAILGLWQSK
jgi:predicted enzyme related to lactoylglutathione lyase